MGRVSGPVADTVERMRTRAAEAGRDPAALGFEAVIGYAAGPDAWAKEVEQWRAAGGTHLCLNTMGAGLAGPRDHIDALRRYAEVVLPKR